MATATPEERRELNAIKDYLGTGGELATLSAALAVDGCFEVGGVLSPVRVEEHEERARVVSYPTQELMLVPARDVTDVPSAIIDDPRRILLSLAEGRLLARKFILRETLTRRRTRLAGEARIYLLDGSDSMRNDGAGRAMGARARMRDAILLAELATLHKRYMAHGRRVRVSLYYRYFTRVLWPIVKVDSADSAMKAMVEVLRTPRRGGTDIEGALLASFELVREARASDPDLARAQIVLVTDGDAKVREEVLRAERERVGDIPVGVSVIALGEENASLRGLVARQRARGERAFYHFIEDSALQAIMDGRVDHGPALHLDAAFSSDRDKSASEIAADLEGEVGHLLDEIGAIGKKRHAGALDAAALESQVMAQALEEVGLPGSVSEGERARREALDRDRRSLERRFGRWFPAPAVEEGKENEKPIEPTEAQPDLGTPERADLDAITIALSTVAEVVSDMGGGALARQADAIEILERLLPDARLSPARYLAVLRAHPSEVAPLLRAVHAAVRPRPAG
jgi:Mg-chelatase subunit ChlD